MNVPEWIRESRAGGQQCSQWRMYIYIYMVGIGNMLKAPCDYFVTGVTTATIATMAQKCQDTIRLF